MTPINSYSGLLDTVAAARDRASLGEKRRQGRNPQSQSQDESAPDDVPPDDVPQDEISQAEVATAQSAAAESIATPPDNGDEQSTSHLDIRA